MPGIDPANLQGLVRSLYRYPLSRHLLFKVTDASKARAFLRALLPQVTNAKQDLSAHPEPLINVGISWAGLGGLGMIKRIGSLESATEAFPLEFRMQPPDGMAGDWKGRLAATDLHLSVHLHCSTDAGLEKASQAMRTMAIGALEEQRPIAVGEDPAITGRSLGGAKLHFGFQDGISQLAVNWEDLPDRPDLVDLRHFVLGYWSPKVQSFPRDGAWGDFVRDGTYAAFQWIRQDVAAFETFLTEAAPLLGGGMPLDAARNLLAAKMMGRWRSGTPMALSPERDDPALTMANAFGYADDPKGLRCPIHAHVRIANRRDQPLDPAIAPTFPGGGPYLLRRGMAYGPELKGDADDGVDRGVVGMFLSSNLQKQFFTIMNWINKADFSPVFDPRRLHRQDFIIGDRKAEGASAGSILVAGAEVSLPAMPRFIEVQGTLLLLMPSIAGLARIAREPS
jgi:deferrochelatase/peroxidase EfeB